MARRRYYKKESGAGSMVGMIALVVGYLWMFNKPLFWTIAPIALLISVATLSSLLIFIGFKISHSKNKKESILNKVQQAGLEKDVNDFIVRFGQNTRKGKTWSHRNYNFEWERLEDFRKILNEKGVGLSTNNWDDTLDLLKYYIQIKEERLTRNSLPLAPKSFDSLPGPEFEKLLYRLFTAMGGTVQMTGKTGDQGGDLVVNENQQRTLVQAKRYKGSTGNEAVQQAVAAMKYYNCNKAKVVTSSEFTREAIDLAKVNNIELISEKQLSDLLLTYLKESWS